MGGRRRVGVELLSDALLFLVNSSLFEWTRRGGRGRASLND